MTLAPGDQLGPYEISELLGKGGMGEVYLAHDPRLRRNVALKVSDAQFSERFEREARAAAQLNHPNICTIHDVGPNYIVMEFVDGETLAQRLKTGPIPLDEALRLANQIIDGMEVAHEKGITHRDLKPANIKIRPDGSVKILDFGLAKIASTPASSAARSENSPTLTMGMTEAGMILGTAAYMAPEQAKGRQDVDKRADIWAFAVILHEMLTTERLFQGEDIGETLASVIKERPDLSRAPQRTRRLLERCLEKDPRKRLRDIGDARMLLEEQPPGPVVERAAQMPPSSRVSRVGWPATVGVLATALATLSFLHFRESPPELRPVSATLLPPDNAEYDFTVPHAMPALSPDGTRLVFGAKTKDGRQQLWLRRLDSPTAQPLPGTEGAATPFWDPTSRWIAFGQDNKLKKIDIQGGPPVAITDIFPAPLRGGSWNVQGVILFGVTSTNPIMRVAASGGTATPAGPANESGRTPWFLPDGRHFLYTRLQSGDIPVRVGSLDQPGKPGKIVAHANSAIAYAQGHLLYLRENTLMAQPFNPDRLETTGEAVPLAENVLAFDSPMRLPAVAVSPAGLLVYLTGTAGGLPRLVWKDRQGKVLGTVGEPVPGLEAIALSPDGTRAAVTILDHSSAPDLWTYDLTRGVPTRFTFDSGSDYEPVWSPDGSTIYFTSDRLGHLNLYRKLANGSGTEELVLQDSASKFSTSISPDGKFLLYFGVDEQSGFDLWVLPLAGKPEPRVFLKDPRFQLVRSQFSPDGHWVVYQSNSSGPTQIYVAPFPGPGGKRQISSAGGLNPRWRRDGKEIFFVSPDGQLMAAEVDARNGTLEVGRVQKLFDGIAASRLMTYDVSLDGQKFLVIDETAPSARPLTLLQNWTATLRK